MKHILALAAVATFLLFACGRVAPVAEETVPGVTRTVSEVTIADGAPVTTADLSISGMSCEMACGGAIKKCLKALPGIASTEIKMVDGDAADHAIVTYNSDEVSDADMIKAIQKIYDGQYKVVAVSITKQVKGDVGPRDEVAPVTKEGEVNASLPEVKIPGILSLLTRVLGL